MTVFYFCACSSISTMPSSPYALSIMGSMDTSEDKTDAQAELYSHLFIMAAYNANYSTATGITLSADDFMAAADKAVYDDIFSAMSAM